MIELLAACMFLAGGQLPDPICTPGAVQSHDRTAICRPGWPAAHRHVLPATKVQVYASYRLSGPHPFPQWEVDHRVPLALGGANTVQNLWPQRAPGFKDRLEVKLRGMVCTGRIALARAVRVFKGDWRKR